MAIITHVHFQSTFLLIYDQPNMVDRWCSRDLLWRHGRQPTKIQWFGGGIALGRVIEESLCVCLRCRGRSLPGLPKPGRELVISSSSAPVIEGCCCCCWWWLWEIRPPSVLQANRSPSQRGQSTSGPECASDDANKNEAILFQALRAFIYPITKMLLDLFPAAGGWADFFCFYWGSNGRKGAAERFPCLWKLSKVVIYFNQNNTGWLQWRRAAHDEVLVTHVNARWPLGADTVRHSDRSHLNWRDLNILALIHWLSWKLVGTEWMSDTAHTWKGA